MPEQLVQLEQPAVAGNAAGPGGKHGRDHGLLLIALFKLAKAIFFFGLGVGAVHLMNKNLSQEVLRLAALLRRDPEGRLVHLVLERVDLIDLHRLRQISLFTFGYSALSLTEGIGLLLEKAWAEYLTLILTISFLPWELFELARDPNWFRFGLLVINVLVLGYLVWLLQRKRRREQQA